MPAWRHRRPLKRWRYVGVFDDALMICVGDVHIGPGRQTFWAVWDRGRRRLTERTRLFDHRAVRLEPGRLLVSDDATEIDITLEENDGVASVCAHGRDGYVWTRKQGGIRAHGRVRLATATHELDARAIVDDSAGYHARSTQWRWAAGVGVAPDGASLAWNLVAGINDPDRGSERTVWVDGTPREVVPARFSEDLSWIAIGDSQLRFATEARRVRHENLLLIASDYEQPFGTFAGTLPGGVEVASGLGVMERHSARW